MTEPNGHEIDHSEGLIPALAACATHAAYLRAVEAGRTLIMARDGWLVRVDPDRSETRLRALPMKHKVAAGAVFHFSSQLRT